MGQLNRVCYTAMYVGGFGHFGLKIGACNFSLARIYMLYVHGLYQIDQVTASINLADFNHCLPRVVCLCLLMRPS